MHDITNNVLTISNDGGSYDRRQAIGVKLLADGNKEAAQAAMAILLRGIQSATPRVFSKEDRSPGCIEATCVALVDEVLCDLAESAKEQVAAPATKGGGPGSSSASSSLAKIPTRSVNPEVLGILRRSTVAGNRVFLPKEQLERKLYASVNEVLAAMGGQWKGGKTQAHVFADAEPDAFEVCFEELQSKGVYTDPRDISFFATSASLAAKCVGMSDLKPGDRFLEPSAGTGAIALEAAKIVGLDKVTCVEFFPPNAAKLRAAGFQTFETDFLGWEPPSNEAEKFDVIVMNPPFSGHQDAAHVQHACRFLKVTGRLVAITSTSWQISSHSSKARNFQEFVASSCAEVEEVAAGAFKQSGTMVSTRIVSISAENLPWNQTALDDFHQAEDDSIAIMEAPAA